MSSTQVTVSFDGAHAAITFATENGVNVMSSAVMRAFDEALAQLGSDKKVRTTVIQAEGKVFIAGADIKEMSGFSWEQAREYGKLGQDVLKRLEALPSITVAVINGAALGGGLEVALACDFRVAVKTAKVGLPETSLGVIPGWNGIPRLTRLVGPARAKRMYLSGMPISADEGASFGLIDEIVNSPEDLPPRVTAFCKSFHRAAPAAVALAKRAFRDGDDVTAFADCFETDDRREGIAAFVEKRPASWME